MEFSHSFPSVTFAVLTVGHLLSAVSARIHSVVGIATRFGELAHFVRFVGKINHPFGLKTAGIDYAVD